MGKLTGRITKFLGQWTNDRETEARGRAEQKDPDAEAPLPDPDDPAVQRGGGAGPPGARRRQPLTSPPESRPPDASPPEASAASRSKWRSSRRCSESSRSAGAGTATARSRAAGISSAWCTTCAAEAGQVAETVELGLADRGSAARTAGRRRGRVIAPCSELPTKTRTAGDGGGEVLHRRTAPGAAAPAAAPRAPLQGVGEQAVTAAAAGLQGDHLVRPGWATRQRSHRRSTPSRWGTSRSQPWMTTSGVPAGGIAAGGPEPVEPGRQRRPAA